jgi:hypothetical protein
VRQKQPESEPETESQSQAESEAEAGEGEGAVAHSRKKQPQRSSICQIGGSKSAMQFSDPGTERRNRRMKPRKEISSAHAFGD